MKRIFSMLVLGAGLVALGGCPIYGDGGGSGGNYCTTSSDCPTGMACDPSSGQCYGGNPGNCTSPSQCGTGQTCGSDDVCHNGDCSTWSCVSGYTCKLTNGTPTCVGNGNDSGPPFTGCTSDSSCSSLGVGSKCLNGSCVAPIDQCNDATQCNDGYQCVQGVCTPSCGPTKACPTGYTCDTTKGVCTGNTNPCTTSNDCSGGNVCVEQHCVAPCSSGSCGTGLVCVDGGCIPDQKPQFVCSIEGTQDACAGGSLCLHHNCYIACNANPDAGTQCKAADKFNVCKQVVTSSGQYSVCGSTSNLGSDCDPTISKNCAGALICIDGFCR